MECRKILYTYFSLQVIFLHRRLNNLSSICHNSLFYIQILFAHTRWVQIYSILQHQCLTPGSGDGSGSIINIHLVHRVPLLTQTSCKNTNSTQGIVLWTDLPEIEPTTESSVLERNTNSQYNEQLYSWKQKSHPLVYLQWFENKTWLLLPRRPKNLLNSSNSEAVWSYLLNSSKVQMGCNL